MKNSVLFNLSITFFILSTVLSGCATVKEVGKGFLGVSTQVLEEKRADAAKKSFALDYNSCYTQVKEILKESGKESEIYAQDLKKKMIAVYFSPTDTTPVGIFFTEESPANTLIEISSASTFAKEELAKKIFTGIDMFINPKVSDLDESNRSQEEKKIDVKEETGN